MKKFLARNIAQYRKSSGLTQEELGNALGVTYQAVSKWENEQAMPDITILPHLASILSVSIDKLLGYQAPSKGAAYYDYENVYGGSSAYYWGVNPSSMCLKVLSLLPPERPLKVLDICCGEGKNAVFLARCGYDVTAFDISSAGIEKTKRLADSARVAIHAFKADICDYRMENNFDILFSSGALHYILPELRDEILANYLHYTNPGGIHAFNVFVRKPFIADPPEKEEHSHFWYSGQLLAYYKDWHVEGFSESVFDCDSSGIPHQHAMNEIFARRPA